MNEKQLLKLIAKMQYEPNDDYDLGWRDALDIIKTKLQEQTLIKGENK